MSMDSQSSVDPKKMRTKDLIFAGAFGAIYLVLMLIVVMVGGAIPILYLLSPLLVGIVCATVYMLCVMRVRKFGAALIIGVLFALIAASSYIPGFCFAIGAALLAELMLKLGNYRSRKMYVLSFVFFNLNMAGPFLMLAFEHERFIALAEQFSGAERAAALNSIAPTGYFWFVSLGLAIIGGLIGGLLSTKLIRKHFEKAGIV